MSIIEFSLKFAAFVICTIAALYAGLIMIMILHALIFGALVTVF